jgi:diamine N-acetyltransferase
VSGTAPRVTLRPVTPATWRACAELEVTEEQGAFVSPVARYLALARYGEAAWQPLALHQGDVVVGHAMWTIDPDEDAFWIGGLVVDRRHQGRGVGRAAVARLVAMAAATGARQVALSYEPANERARRVYADAGFRETGELVDDEVVARLDLPV